MQNSVFVLLVSLFLCLRPMIAQEVVQYSSEAENIFLEGLQRFNSNDFGGANEDFTKVVTQYPSSQRTSAAYLMAAKSLFHLHRYDESIQVVQTFLGASSQSRYLADAHFTLGMDFYLSRRYEPAAGEFVKVLESTKEKDLLDKAAPLLEGICTDNLNAGVINRLYQVAVSPQAKFLLALKISEQYIAAGNPDQARALLAPLLKQYPAVVYAARAKELLRIY